MKLINSGKVFIISLTPGQALLNLAWVGYNQNIIGAQQEEQDETLLKRLDHWQQGGYDYGQENCRNWHWLCRVTTSDNAGSLRQ